MGAFSCLKRLVSVLGVVLCVFIVAFVFALGWSNGWWGGQDDSASSDPDLYKVIAAEDGSYVDVEDKNSVSQYVVVGQSVEPNTEFHLSFEKNPDGTEKDDTPSPSLTNITLTVAPL